MSTCCPTFSSVCAFVSSRRGSPLRRTILCGGLTLTFAVTFLGCFRIRLSTVFPALKTAVASFSTHYPLVLWRVWLPALQHVMSLSTSVHNFFFFFFFFFLIIVPLRANTLGFNNHHLACSVCNSVCLSVALSSNQCPGSISRRGVLEE